MMGKEGRCACPHADSTGSSMPYSCPTVAPAAVAPIQPIRAHKLLHPQGFLLIILTSTFAYTSFAISLFALLGKTYWITTMASTKHSLSCQ